ncbi:MAG: dihydroorotate dehydrogenase [Coriobacteriia bacterium]
MSASVDLAVRLGPLELASPVLTASGTFGSGREFERFVDLSRLGAVVTKGVSAEPWPGSPGVRTAETASGMLNSIGLQNPGVDAFCGRDMPWLAALGVPVIVNVAGHSVEEYVRVIERLETEPVDAYEINVSCPNVDEGGMAFGVSREGVSSVTAACRAATARPLIVKMTPNVTDVRVIATAAVEAGADALSCVNTLLGMAVDADSRRPVLGRVVGGLSGPAIKPVALRVVWEVSNAVGVPVIGMGGITEGRDAVEFMLAGASAVAVGTANFIDPRATMRVLDGIIEYCRQHGVGRVSELTGSLEV